MANLLDTMIQTIQKDFESLQGIEDPKSKRKEGSLLKVRINSALKLCSDSPEKVKLLNTIIDSLSKK